MLFRLFARCILIIYFNNCLTKHLATLEQDDEVNGGKLNRKMSISSEEEDLSKKYIPPQPMRDRLADPLGSTCENRKKFDDIAPYFQFFPALKGKLYKKGDKFTFKNRCFFLNHIEVLSITNDELKLKLTAQRPEGRLCIDTFLLMTSTILQFEVIFFKGEHIISIPDLSQSQLLEIAVNGLRVFSFCDSLPKVIYYMLLTANFMTSTPPPPPQSQSFMQYFFGYSVEQIEDEHTLFLKRYTGMEFPIRKGWDDKVIELEPFIQSGDFFGGAMLASGESSFILYTSGGQISHSAMALRVDGKLFVVEMNDDGLSFKTYKDFIQTQLETHHTVAWFPLREDMRKRFDVDKAVDWVQKRVGMPYGMRTFVTSNLDTVIGGGGPEFLSADIVMFIVTFLEKANPDMAKEYLLDSLSKRIDKENQSLSELTEDLAKRNITFEEALLMPERDDYLYYGQENWICSSVIVNIWKEGGLFGDLDINAHEFTSRDISLMDIFNTTFTRPAQCEEADPDISYCMILGRHRLLINGYSSVPLEAHMFERCPNFPPFYFRPDHC